MELEQPYSAQLTREPFLFHEMRTTAQLMQQGMDDETIIAKVYDGNLFQYPTEKSLKRMTRACLRRLHAVQDAEVVRQIAEASADTARQLCLYVMLLESRLFREFMLQVVAVKYRQRETRLSRADVQAFFLHLSGQSGQVAGWSESTVKKIISVFMGILTQNGYLTNARSSELQVVIVQPAVRDAMKRGGHAEWLSVFQG